MIEELTEKNELLRREVERVDKILSSEDRSNSVRLP